VRCFDFEIVVLRLVLLKHLGRGLYCPPIQILVLLGLLEQFKTDVLIETNRFRRNFSSPWIASLFFYFLLWLSIFDFLQVWIRTQI